MFIVHVYDWNSEETHHIGPFSAAEAASLWIEGQARNDNEDIDYEICLLEAP